MVGGAGAVRIMILLIGWNLEVTQMRTRLPWRKRLLFSSILVGLLSILCELGSLAVIWLVPSIDAGRISKILTEQSRVLRRLAHDPAALTTYDPVLGWRYRPNYASEQYQINSQGLRSRKTYTSRPIPGVVRVVAFGDSFVYCSEVANEDSWPYLIEARSPRIEVLNFGVGGYGTDQAYIRYKSEGYGFSPHIVIIGFVPINIGRVVNVYRGFVSSQTFPGTKPRYELSEEGDLVLIPNPVTSLAEFDKYVERPLKIRELGEHDDWYEPLVYDNPLYDLSAAVRLSTRLWTRTRRRYLDMDRVYSGSLANWGETCTFRTSSSAFRIQVAVTKRFVREARESGSTPLVVVFPDRESILRSQQGKRKVYDPFVEELRSSQIECVDLISGFVADGVEGTLPQWFMPHGHYSPLGNRIVASQLWDAIRVISERK